MNLHEYQAKGLFKAAGIPVPDGDVASSAAEAVTSSRALGGSSWMIKAQVHAGGRGKGGGIKRAENEQDVSAIAQQMLGSQLVTPQTGPGGLPVNQLLLEIPCDIAREFYVGVVIDRARERVSFMVSSEGGMEIEAVAASNPEKIHTLDIDPAAGLQPYQCRRAGFALGLEAKQVGAFARIMQALYQCFLDNDASLIEINPLVLTSSGEFLALDAKINLDDNAVFRHPDLLALRDISQEDAKEAAAREFDLNYITLDGNIACMVNGAGLAMATMDIIKLNGGEPANFLDVGGGTTAEKVTEAFKLIVSDEKVRAILVNIFGGIVRCDLIAEGIINAVKEVAIDIPVVVRLEGTNVDKGIEMLDNSSFDIIGAEDLGEAARKVVEAAHLEGNT
ncbi:MAG: ADP-forming succinate--CoA ligase subunit beta [Gammaproteobacteria bacterium]|nr:MAG: ADP-forming succinate--CoA ligase subunit beta [Gammaproteobacteria bacterium]